MNCQECRASFEQSLDVALKGGEQRKVSLHLSRCKDCRSYFEKRRRSHADAYRAINAALSDEHLPEGFTERFQAFLAQENAMPQKHWKYLGMFRKIAAVLAAMLFFAGLSYAAALVANELGRNESSRETDAGESSKVNESLSTASDPVSADAAVSETPLSIDALSGEKTSRYDSATEVMPQASFKNYNQQSGEDTMKRTKTVAAVLSAAMVSAPLAAADISVKSSVFDDVKIWYKGSAGNAIDSADSGNNRICLVKNLPDMADSSSILHGGEYFWWGWRMSYKSMTVVCPYAGITFDSSSCMAVDSPVTTNGSEIVNINGTEMEQPKLHYRTGYLSFTNWLAGCESDCSNYTVFLRFCNESINPVPGDHNRVFSLGSQWTSVAGYPAGLDLRMAPAAQLSEYAYPKIFVGSVGKDCTEVRIKNGCWADCAIAVDGGAVTATFCWNDGPSNLIAKVSCSYPETGPLPAVPAGGVAIIGGEKGRESCSFTYGVECGSSNWTYGFRGAFHQIAFWDRTLSDNEIREAMAAGAGRPNLISVGIEGNGIAEFATAGRQSSVANAGAWEYLNPTLTDDNRSVEISFLCPANWAGMPQWLRLPMAADSGTGRLAVKLNGEAIGSVAVSSGRVAKLYVPENKIASGANTLVLELESGASVVMDAVTLGGSWKFGNAVESFSRDDALQVKTSPDRYVFNPACGYDKLHSRALNSSVGDRETAFEFFVPRDMVGVYRGVFQSRTQQAAATTSFDLLINGLCKLSGYVLKRNTDTDKVNLSTENIVAGWNRIAWKTYAGSSWGNMDWHKFTVLPAPMGLVIVVR